MATFERWKDAIDRRPRRLRPTAQKSRVARLGRAAIVVGIDESLTALDAVEWAAAEAASCDRPLRLVHASTLEQVWDPFGVAAVESYDDDAIDDEILEEALSRARSVAPELQVTSQATVGSVAAVLRSAAEDAHLVVLGRSRPGRHPMLGGRSVVGQATRYLACPVAVIQPFATVPLGPSVARVVVGVGDASLYSAGGHSEASALRYAFEAAARRGIGLTAVRAWIPPMTDGADDVAAGKRAGRRTEHRLLDSAVGGLRRMFPTVHVTTKIVSRSAAEALTAESAGAALTVVGSTRQGWVREMLCGSVSRRLSDRVQSPLVIVDSR